MNSISIIGASGHAKVIIELVEELGYKIDKIFDEDLNKIRLFNYDICHDFSNLPKNSIIAIGDNFIREKIASENFFVVNPIVHKNSFVSKSSILGNGTVVMSGVSINSSVQIGNHCIINTNSSIDHDCKIDDFVHISPNAALAGGVTIGKGTHIGIGACVIQGIKIGKGCMIGAGSVVIRDVLDYELVVGNPAKIKQN